jgi:hypothetical protein
VEHVDDQHEPTPDNDNDNDRALEALDTDIDIDGPDVLDDSAVPFDVGQDDLPTRIAHAKQRHGVAGAMLAAGMLGVDQVLNGRKPREEAPIVVDANGEPVDIDRDGIAFALDDDGTHVSAPPLPRTSPVTAPPRRKRWLSR